MRCFECSTSTNLLPRFAIRGSLFAVPCARFLVRVVISVASSGCVIFLVSTATASAPCDALASGVFVCFDSLRPTPPTCRARRLLRASSGRASSITERGGGWWSSKPLWSHKAFPLLAPKGEGRKPRWTEPSRSACRWLLPSKRSS